jgi:hypothetical protein
MNYYKIEYSGILKDGRLTAIRNDFFKANNERKKESEIQKIIKNGKLDNEEQIVVSVYQKIENREFKF